jgi:hypothetical protein
VVCCALNEGWTNTGKHRCGPYRPRAHLVVLHRGTDWQKTSRVTGATVTAMVLKDLIERDASERLTLTGEGRAALAVLLKIAKPISGERRRALAMLADAGQRGPPHALLLANGFSRQLLTAMVRDRQAVAATIVVPPWRRRCP